MIDNTLTCKIVLVGGGGVGKTNIISRIVDNKFSSLYVKTIDRYDKYMEVKDYSNKIHLNIWDTFGGSEFQSLSWMFYKNSDIILIVFNITNRNTFNEAINYWIAEINKQKLDKCFVYLVANFCEVDEAYAVSVEELKRAGDDNNLKIYMISAKNNVGIKEMIEDIVHNYVHDYFHKLRRIRLG